MSIFEHIPFTAPYRYKRDPKVRDSERIAYLKDREYLVACLRRGEDPRAEPRIRIDTIHASKGAEADNVIVMSDISKQSYVGSQIAPDDEHRVFYVALTRAINNLHLVQPQTSMFYRL